MGIDRIGSKGIPSPAGDASAVSPGRGTGQAFEVARPATSEAAAVAPSESALARLQSGQIDVDGYLDLKVNEATAHLQALPPAQLEEIRAALRDRMTTDPTLADLVRTASGGLSPVPRDD